MRPPAPPKPPPATVRAVQPPPAPAPPPADRAALRRASRDRRRVEAAERHRYARRHRARRLLVVAVGVLTVAAAGVAPALAFTPVFAVRTISVPGASSPVAAAVRAALAAQLGRPVALVSDADVTAAVRTVPAVERFAIVRLPPSTLEVRVTERTGVVQEQRAGGWVLEDAAGVALGSRGTRWPDVAALTLSAGTAGRTAAIATTAAALAALARTKTAVTAVSATNGNDVVLQVRGLTVRWGGAEHAAAKAQALAAALEAVPAKVSEIDVSSPGLVQTR